MISRLSKSTIKLGFPKTKSMLSGNLSRPDLRVEYVVVAGGGGGGQGYSSAYGGSGGAGGYRSSVYGELSGGGNPAEDALLCPSGTSYTITVGVGGRLAQGVFQSGESGSDSVFGTITSVGGGGGAGSNTGAVAKSGGSGGGGCINNPAGGGGTQGQGSQGGGYTDGGGPGYGGGAKSQGCYPFYYSGYGQYGGGEGITSSITGSAVVYAQGGSYLQGATARANSGDGGNPGYTGAGCDGAKGIVILRFPSSRTITGGSGLSFTNTTVGSNKVYTFTNGTGTVTIN
jgi:hypothetical protein